MRDRLRRPPRAFGEVLVVVLATAVDLLLWHYTNGSARGIQPPAGAVPGVIVVADALLLARWRFPGQVFVAQWIVASTALVVPQLTPVAGLLVALHAVARVASLRIALVSLVLCSVPFGIDSINSYLALGSAGAELALLQVTFLAILMLAVWGLGRLAYRMQRHNEIVQQLQAAQAAEQLRAERLRLARELHDIVTHAVSTMVLQAGAARLSVGRSEERLGRSLDVIEEAGAQAMGELHRLLTLLRAASDASGDDVRSSQHRVEDIPALVELSRSSGLHIQTASEGSPVPLDGSVGLAAYRIVQEALTNTTKHAGPGAAVELRFAWRPERLVIDIRDRPGTTPDGVRAGVGHRLLSSGHGLAGLAERVNLVGGTIATGPADAGGFVVHAELPVTVTALPKPRESAAVSGDARDLAALPRPTEARAPAPATPGRV